ncbi:MAG: sensor histidine kinase [Burkholderiales bacterium]
MKKWLHQSFFRQVSLLLLAFSVLSISGYAYQNYNELKNQWRSAINIQISHLTGLAALMVANDLRYEKYFDLWDKLRKIQNQTPKGEEGALFLIAEIVVLDNSGNVVGSSDPVRHPLMRRYSGQLPQSSDEMQIAGDGTDSVRTIAPILFGGERIGSLVMAFDITPFSSFLHQHLRDFAVYLILMAVATALFGLALARWITRPLGNVCAILPMLGSGQAMIPSLSLRQDEYGLLGRAIEFADRRLHESDAQIRMHRDHLEEMVKQRTQALEAANRELEAFSYSVSHDLRAPLRAIDGFSLALVEDYGDKLDDAAKGYLQRVRGGAQKMGGLIDDMLQLSRVTRAELHYAVVDLSAMAEQIVLGLGTQDPRREVQVSIAPGLVVSGDAGLLGIMLQNLLGNAWKFTKGKREARIEFDSRMEHGERIFFIRDNGAGFDMRYVSKLFGAFQRLHTEDEFPGTGIGLATVQRIINRHGGRVWAEGEVGVGACFYFVLK